MTLSLDIGLHLLREAARLRNVVVMNKLKDMVPGIRETAFFKSHVVTATNDCTRDLKTHVIVQAATLDAPAKATLRMWQWHSDAIPTPTRVNGVKKFFKMGGWRWEQCYKSKRVCVYRRGNMMSTHKQHTECASHEENETCVVCEPVPFETTVELPRYCDAKNTRSVRQCVRCHKARNNIDIEYVYCAVYPDKLVPQWQDVADLYCSLPQHHTGLRRDPRLLPCYTGLTYDTEWLVPDETLTLNEM